MRRIWVLPSNVAVDAQAIADATTNTCTEIVVGPSPFMLRAGFNDALPTVYIEPDDPEAAPVALAVAQLRNTFQTQRTAAQVNNSLDALTILMKQLYGKLR